MTDDVLGRGIDAVDEIEKLANRYPMMEIVAARYTLNPKQTVTPRGNLMTPTVIGTSYLTYLSSFKGINVKCDDILR